MNDVYKLYSEKNLKKRKIHNALHFCIIGSCLKFKQDFLRTDNELSYEGKEQEIEVTFLFLILLSLVKFYTNFTTDRSFPFCLCYNRY